MASNCSHFIKKSILASYALFVIYICITILYHRINGTKPTHFIYLTVDLFKTNLPAKIPLYELYELLKYFIALACIYLMLFIIFTIYHEPVPVGRFMVAAMLSLAHVALVCLSIFYAKLEHNAPVYVYLGLTLVTCVSIWLIYDQCNADDDQRHENAQDDHVLSNKIQQQKPNNSISKCPMSKMWHCMFITKNSLLFVYFAFLVYTNIAFIEIHLEECRFYRMLTDPMPSSYVLIYRLNVASFVSLCIVPIGLFFFSIIAPLTVAVHVLLVSLVLILNEAKMNIIAFVVCQAIFAIIEIVSLWLAHDLYTIWKWRKVVFKKMANRGNVQIVSNKMDDNDGDDGMAVVCNA